MANRKEMIKKKKKRKLGTEEGRKNTVSKNIGN